MLPWAPRRRASAPPDGRADRRALTGDSLQPVLLGMGAMYAVVAVLREWLAPGSGDRLVVVTDVALSVLLVGTGLVSRHHGARAWLHARAQEVGLVLGLLATLDVMATLVVARRPEHGLGCLLLVMVVGSLLQHSGYATAVVAVAVAQWCGVAVWHGLAGPWLTETVMAGVAVVTAAVLHASRRRTADELVEARTAIRRAAMTDELTGLANRRELLAAVRCCLERPDRSTALLLLDVDGLGHVNDTRGHAEGDRLLLATADALRLAASPGQVAGRLGGDEFALLLPCDEAAAVALDRVGAALTDAGVSASTGVAQAVAGESAEQLLARADGAMYEVKRRRQVLAPTPPTTGAWLRPLTPGQAEPLTWRDPGERVRADLRQLTIASAVVHLVLVPLHLLLLTGAGRVQTAAVSVLVAVALGAVLAARRWIAPWTRRHAELALTAVVALIDAEALLHVVLAPEDRASTALLIVVVLTGALVPRRSWALLATTGTVAVWGVLVLTGGVGDVGHPMVLNLAVAVAAGALLHLVQARTLARLTAAQAQLHAAATTDDLTGLANRRGLLRSGRVLVADAARRGDALALLLLDLDGLKVVNDTQGHAAGDTLLAAAAAVVADGCGTGEVCARFGGDEFVVLVPGLRARQAPLRAAALQAALAARGVSATVGTAQLEARSSTLETLLVRADRAVHRQRAQCEPAAAAATR